MNLQKKYTKHILSFLEERPYINISALERAARVAPGAIALAKSAGRNIPEVAIFQIMSELAKSGIKDVEGNSLEFDPKTYCLFGSKKIEDIKTTEVLQNKRTGEVIEREITDEMNHPEWEDPYFNWSNKGFKYYKIFEEIIYSNYMDLLY